MATALAGRSNLGCGLLALRSAGVLAETPWESVACSPSWASGAGPGLGGGACGPLIWAGLSRSKPQPPNQWGTMGAVLR